MAPGLWSRSVTWRHVAPYPCWFVEGFISRLAALVRCGRHGVVLAGTDASLGAVSHYRVCLAPYVQLGLPSRVIVERALDRERLAVEAAAVGLGSPEARVCITVEEALEAASSFGYPYSSRPCQRQGRPALERNGSGHRWASRSSVLCAGARGTLPCTRSLHRWAAGRGAVVSFFGVLVGQAARTWCLQI